MRANSTLIVLALTAAMAAVSVAPTHAQGSRLSLAERVQQLESQAQGGGQNTVELLNRITELQAENGVLRGLVEQQNFEIEELKKRQRDQYVDIDSRLSRLEGGGASAASSPQQLSEEMIAPTSADDLPMEPPVLREPLDGGVLSQTLEGEIAADQSEPALPVGDPREERLAYESAFEALKDGRYAESARRFQSFLDIYPSGEYAPNALYWLGESYYVTQNYAVAQEQFQRLLEAHPRSSKAPDALLKLGYTHYELRQWPEAEQVLNDVVRRYPDTTVSRLAQGRLRALMLESRR